MYISTMCILIVDRFYPLPKKMWEEGPMGEEIQSHLRLWPCRAGILPRRVMNWNFYFFNMIFYGNFGLILLIWGIPELDLYRLPSRWNLNFVHPADEICRFRLPNGQNTKNSSSRWTKIYFVQPLDEIYIFVHALVRCAWRNCNCAWQNCNFV